MPEDTHPTPNTAAAQIAAAQASAAAEATGSAPNTPHSPSQPTKGDDDKPTYTRPATQADLDRIIESRLARERQKFSDYDDLLAKAKAFDEAEEAKKTTEQKAAERIAALEKENHAFKLAETKARIAAEHGISPDLLAGDDEKALANQAEKIAAAIDQAKPKTGPQLYGEAASTKAPGSSTDWLRDQLINKH